MEVMIGIALKQLKESWPKERPAYPPACYSGVGADMADCLSIMVELSRMGVDMDDLFTNYDTKDKDLSVGARLPGFSGPMTIVPVLSFVPGEDIESINRRWREAREAWNRSTQEDREALVSLSLLRPCLREFIAMLVLAGVRFPCQPEIDRLFAEGMERRRQEAN
jgi:hypothetical protein